MQTQPLGHTSSAVIPASPPLSFPPFKRESILDYADVNPAYANWIPAYKACPCRL